VSDGYPPEPWRLRGDLHTSVFLVPCSDVPAQLPPGWRPVRIGRWAVVGTAWASYRPGGVLVYDELMSTVLVRRGWRLVPTITHIWVDSVASRDGARALWGIPKQLGTFAFAGTNFAARSDERSIATGRVRRRLGLPVRVPIRFRVVQSLDGRAKLTPVRARARLALARATFAADPAGPLAFLAGMRPALSLSVLDFRMTFG
jgi:hypothetical protein